MRRTGALAVAALGLWAVGVGARVRWPERASALACAPGAVRLGGGGVARCGPGEPVSSAQRLLLGQKLDLNRVAEVDLARVPGVGASLARRVVAERLRRGGFASWAEVARVPGVGPARLVTLQETMVLREAPGPRGVW